VLIHLDPNMVHFGLVMHSSASLETDGSLSIGNLPSGGSGIGPIAGHWATERRARRGQAEKADKEKALMKNHRPLQRQARQR
jgi:hypothetical protein